VIDVKERVQGLKIPLIHGLSLKEFVHMMSLFDYVISVDTGCFHLAAALGIPTLGIFGWTDGKILSKYHPKVKILQRHRDDDCTSHDWASSCPCWNWPTCPHKMRGKPTVPLKCMEDFDAKEIDQAFSELVAEYPAEEKSTDI